MTPSVAPGQAMHRKPVNDRWRAALKRAGITCDRYHMMHVLRHTAASAWPSAGISVWAVAEFPRRRRGDHPGDLQPHGARQPGVRP
jgi:hypothetical protein